MIDNLCLNGSYCAATVDGHAREVGAPGQFCPDCLDRAAQRIHQIPEYYCRLAEARRERSHTLTDICRVKPSSVVLLNVHIDTLMGEITHTVQLAAEIIADQLGCDDPDSFTAATELIAGQLPLLCDQRELDVVLWVPTGTARYVATVGGTDIVYALDQLVPRAYRALGLSLARIRRDMPCTRCGSKTVGRWAGSDQFDCTTCGSRFNENDLRRQDLILLALHKRGQLKVTAS